jgi:hypothetical protein
MRLRWALGGVVVWLAVVIALAGCSKKKEEASRAEKPEATESSIPATASKVSATEPTTSGVQTAEPPASQTVSETMELFLERKVRMRPAAEGQEIRAFFASWEQTFTRRSRQPVDVHFEVEADGQFDKDHVWQSSTLRGILDEMAREYGLAWTIVKPNTIRITREPE